MTDAAQEKLRSVRPSSEKPHEAESSREGKTSEAVKSKTEKILSTRDTESSEDSEGIETGRVAEQVGEDQSQASQGSFKQARTDDEIEAIRAKLLAAVPPQAVMVQQIRKKLYAQKKTLTKKMKKLQKKADRNAFQLNILVAQLRKIREYFSVLAHATYEMIKHLWLKIVHGV